VPATSPVTNRTRRAIGACSASSLL
jgi:hypothetical protein